MTRNQIDWQNMLISGQRQKEDVRHNVASEIEARRSNLAKEKLTSKDLANKQKSLDEAIRHNQVSEWLDNFRNTETQRHNQMDELRNELNVQLQHADRAQTNAINKAFNDISAATRELERMDKRENMENTVDIARDKIVNDYNLALANLRNEVNKTEISASKAPSEISRNKGDTFRSYASGAQSIVDSVGKSIKSVAELLALMG